MNRNWICLCLVLALLAACAPAAFAAEGMKLPVPPPTETPAPEAPAGGLPVPITPAPVVVKLPHPGSFFGEEGSLSLTGYAYDGAVWDVWYFQMEFGWNDRLTDWLKACTDAGFSWKPGAIEGNSSYTVTNGEMRALLLPDYYGQIMFMKQDGLEMDDFALPELQELQLNQVHLIYNGVDYGFIDPPEEGWVKSHYGAVENLRPNLFARFEFTRLPIRKIVMMLPDELLTGDSLHITKEKEEYRPLSLTIDGVKYMNAGNLLSASDADYCDITVIYRDEEAVRATYEGSFKKGAVQIFLKFYLDLAEPLR